MTLLRYRVYKNVSKGKEAVWEPAGSFADLEDAEGCARALCPRGPIYTEPGLGLKKGFFGAESSKRWAAMVTDAEKES